MRVVATLVVLAIVVVVLAWAFQRRLIYLPAGHPAATAEQALAGGSAVIVHTEDGRTSRPGTRRRPGRPPARACSSCPATLVHARRGCRLLARCPPLDSTCCCWTIAGTGAILGSPTEQGLAADARAAHHYLVADRGVPPARLVLFGESLGAAVATRLARERLVGGWYCAACSPRWPMSAHCTTRYCRSGRSCVTATRSETWSGRSRCRSRSWPGRPTRSCRRRRAERWRARRPRGIWRYRAQDTTNRA